jgi:hypothetical protein
MLLFVTKFGLLYKDMVDCLQNQDFEGANVDQISIKSRSVAPL